jgi:predicted aldo/keto reductase-like oxidoreductase
LGVLDELKESLERLQTDHVDLIQVHAVNTWADLEQALAPDGAVAALETAREQGMARFIGITGHARPEILGYALRNYPFDTVLVALGVADRLVTSPETFVLPIAQEQSVGVIAMKVFGHGTYPDRARALRYALGLSGVSLAILGLDTPDQIDEAVENAVAFQPLGLHEQDRLIQEIRPLVQRDANESQEGKSPLFWLHDTAVTGWQHQDEPAIVAY